MKKSSAGVLLFLSLALFAAQMARAQGTLYVSNIGGRPFGRASIGSDSWGAQLIETGNNSGGYLLNSVQLLMAAASGAPSGFDVSIYSDVDGLPSADLGNLSGSSNPSSAATYTYSASDLALAPSTDYFIMATATTQVAQGAYTWYDDVGTAPPGLDQWMIDATSFQSANEGVNWTPYPNGAEFHLAIYATAIPEPSTWMLCLLGGGFAFYVHARKRREEVDQQENVFIR